MPSKYWIKLYHEILDDPKMGRMSEVLFARCIKFFLVAGDFHKKGRLPSLDDMAWRLRIPAEELESDLIELQTLGITANKEGVWSITKWQERQGPMSEKHRSRLRREEARHVEYLKHGPAHIGPRPDTDRYRDRITVADTDKDKERDKEKEEKKHHSHISNYLPGGTSD